VAVVRVIALTQQYIGREMGRMPLKELLIVAISYKKPGQRRVFV
jgi:hypothetical protein